MGEVAVKTRRTKAQIADQRQVDWELLRHDGHHQWSACLACGEVAFVRGRTRDAVRCVGCFIRSADGAPLTRDVLGGAR